MKKLLLILIFIVYANAAMITGNQGKLSISGGSMSVSSGGSTVNVGSGEITFIEEGAAPTSPRMLNPGEMDNITNELKMTDDSKLVNLKFVPLKHIITKKIRRFLIKAGIPARNIEFEKKDNKTALYIKQIDINLIKGIYPAYYKAVNSYYKKNQKRLRKTAKVPTILIKLKMIKRYHRSIYNKYR